MINKICCFIGHRVIVVTEQLKEKLKELIEYLIVNYNVLTFLFGSKSDFDKLCHLVVTELKKKYPNIKRISYTCRSESCFLESEREKWEKLYSKYSKDNVRLLCVEEEFEFKAKYTAGKASYIERNQAMIDDSDYCIFFYDENYNPKQKQTKPLLSSQKPKSGTKLAYEYAKRKKKQIININTLLNKPTTIYN